MCPRIVEVLWAIISITHCCFLNWFMSMLNSPTQKPFQKQQKKLQKHWIIVNYRPTSMLGYWLKVWTNANVRRVKLSSSKNPDSIFKRKVHFIKIKGNKNFSHQLGLFIKWYDGSIRLIYRARFIFSPKNMWMMKQNIQ